MAWLETIHDSDLKKERVNVLKGQALETLLKYFSGRKHQNTLKDIAGSIDEEDLHKYYRAKKMFRVTSESGDIERLYRKSSSEALGDFNFVLDEEEYEDGKKYSLGISADNKEVFLGYRSCSHCDYIYPPKFCKKCGGGAICEHTNLIIKKISEANEKYDKRDGKKVVRKNKSVDQFLEKVRDIKASKWNSEQWEGLDWCICDRMDRQSDEKTHYYHEDSDNGPTKCPKCRQGTLSKMSETFSERFKTVETGLSFSELKQYLVEEGIVSRLSLDKLERIDLWEYDGDLYITEAKNNELSGLDTGSVIQTSYYLRALSNITEKAKNATIIYNGDKKDSVDDVKKSFNSKYGFEIETQSLKDYCRAKNFYFEKVILGTKNTLDDPDIRCSETGRYWLEIVDAGKFEAKPVLELKVR